MKLLKKTLPITLLILSILFIGSSCDGNDNNNEPEVQACDQSGLYYQLDGGNEVYLPQTTDNVNIVFLDQNTGNSTGDFLMVHELPNGYLFQSSATDIGQMSSQPALSALDLANNEQSKLDILNLWSNTDTVTITFKCTQMETQVNGNVQYTFEGDYTSAGTQHHITGKLCVKIDEIR